MTHGRYLTRRLALAALALALAGTPATLGAQEHRHDNEEAIKQLAKALDLRPGSVVADVGAGDGAYALPLARLVGDAGRVIAVDISTRALERLRARITREGVGNIDVVQGQVDNPGLTPGSVDAVLIVNAYHEMTQYQAMLGHLRAALKPQGRLVIADFASPSRRQDPRATQTSRHEIAPELVQQEVRAAGFRIVGFEDPFMAGHGHGNANHVEWLLTLAPAAAVPAATTADAPADVDLSAPDLRIAFDEFMRLYRDNKVIVLDVRDRSMFESGHIPNARSAPMSALRDLLPELKSSTLPIVTYCECPAEETSARAAVYLRQRGVANVKALLGGWEKWLAENQPRSLWEQSAFSARRR